MAVDDALKEYRERRNFDRTPEPPPEPEKTGRQSIFVIQKHDARNLHYDFRLEADGVLKSWAVPKGLSTDPATKRLAVPTEDHPLEYAGFEGIIPAGEYGAGTVLVWDRGIYRNETERDGTPVSVREALESGHLSVWLEGGKLRGGYALTRFKTGRDEAWLIVKKNDAGANPHRNPVTTEPRSILTGRTLEEIAAGRQA